MSDEPSQAGELAEASLAIARLQLDELKRRMEGMPKMRTPQLQQLTGMTAKVMRAAAPLMKEMRQLVKDARDWAAALGYDDKRRVMVDFFRLMPPEHQRALVQELTRVLNERRSA